MSYNVTRWQQIRCSLSFSRATLQQSEFEAEFDLNNRITIDLYAEDSEMTGVFDPAKGVATIDKVYFSGEGSGRNLDRVIKFLALAQGSYEALIIWECGDSISHLTINNGVVQYPDLDVVKTLQRLQAAMELITALKGVAAPQFDPILGAQWRSAFRNYEGRLKTINEQT